MTHSFPTRRSSDLMQRRDFTIPLLIGGATTSRAHTALKIDPHYKSPTVWVKDASRAVGVAQSLISKELRDAFIVANDADYAEIRERHRNRSEEHTSELQSLMRISYAVFCLKKKNKIQTRNARRTHGTPSKKEIQQTINCNT